MTTVLRLLDDMQFYKLELVNLEQNYNILQQGSAIAKKPSKDM